MTAITEFFAQGAGLFQNLWLCVFHVFFNKDWNTLVAELSSSSPSLSDISVILFAIFGAICIIGIISIILKIFK